MDGEEYGVFIARAPGAPLRILSIVHKTFPHVTGDGRRSLRELILDHPRARLIADGMFTRWAAELARVPGAGEALVLVEIGAHSRGSLFLDVRSLASADLAATLTRLTDAVPGYAFGRIDLRVPSAAHLRRGEGLKVLELNGVGAESAHIYDPDTPLLDGYRTMLRQWSLAFAIGAAQARRGAQVTGLMRLLCLARQDRARSRQWF